jgi:hypothetical protein
MKNYEFKLKMCLYSFIAVVVWIIGSAIILELMLMAKEWYYGYN